MADWVCSDCDYYEPINGKGKCKACPPCRNITSSPGHVNVIIDGWPEVDGNGVPCSAFKKE